MSFLNVDLDLTAPRSLDSLVAAFGPAVAPLDREPSATEWYASLELDVPLSPAEEADPEVILARFCDLIEALPAEVRAAWHACTQRDFNLGFESWRAERGAPIAEEVRLSTRTLSRVAALGATVSITVYAEPSAPTPI